MFRMYKFILILSTNQADKIHLMIVFILDSVYDVGYIKINACPINTLIFNIL